MNEAVTVATIARLQKPAIDTRANSFDVTLHLMHDAVQYPFVVTLIENGVRSEL